jgi:hypothetical protein
LKYAIGEILLVMVGILLALQVNNWNENRKTEARIGVHYSEVKEELKFDLERIEQHILSLENVDSAGLYMREFLEKKLTTIDSARLKKMFLMAGYYATFEVSRVAYDNLVGSGDINLIANNSLKRELGNYHNSGGWNKTADAGYVRQSIEEYHHYRHNFIAPLMDRFLMNNEVLSNDLPDDFNKVDGSINDFSVDWQKVRDDKEYSIKLDKIHTARLNQKLLYYELKYKMIYMIKLIDDELEKNDLSVFKQ